MAQLDYEALEAEPGSSLTAVLIALPIVAGLLTLYVVGKNAADSPYGVFEWSDALLQVGGSGTVLVIWLIWLALVLSKRRSMRPVSKTMALMLWGGFNCWIAYHFGVGYFGEIWNR